MPPPERLRSPREPLGVGEDDLSWGGEFGAALPEALAEVDGEPGVGCGEPCSLLG